jgi:hypothetical protein
MDTLDDSIVTSPESSSDERVSQITFPVVVT